MIKFSSATGEYVSSKVFGGTNNDDKIMTATATEDGGVLLGGWFYSKDFDIDGDGTNDITSTTGQNDAIIVKLNARNEVEWYKTFDGNSYDENYGITQLSNKSFVAVGGFDSTSLSCGDTANLLRSQGYSDAYIINLDNVVTSAEIPEIQEINVENKLKEFKITTEIEENSDGERGGSITGTLSENNINFVEKVKYDYDSITPILITPEAGYSVYSVEINGEKVEFRPDTNGVVTLPVFSKVQEDKHIKVLFEKNVSSVVVHHYIKDRDGNYTTDKAADDEYIIGKIGSKYETAPKIDIERYGLEKDTDGNYIVPSNAKGTFEQTETVVTYYYQETPFSLTVHHYLEGTEDKLEVDEVSSLYKDTEYTTSPSKELLKRYTLVSSATRVTPESAGTSGKIQENTEVSYYYKLKEYQITTEVKEHDETDIGGNISKVKGGNISGEEMTPYETVIINQDSTKDITITADEGYQIKSITIQSIDENGSITEENVKITGKNTTYNLNKFNDVTSNKHVIVEFERIIGTLTVHHYVEGTTNHVPLAGGSTADDESKSGYIGNNYATKARTDINENYELVGVPENSSGEYIDGNIEVIYYYKLKDTSVLVHHYLEGTTTKLAEDETKLGKVGDKYTTSSANVDSKYELVTTPNNANGTMTLDQIIVTYYYRVKDTSVLVHHYKEGTTEKVSEDVTKKGKIDDEYTTTIADDLPEYYELVEEPTNKTGTMTEEQIVVTYYYRLKKYQYTVNYLEKGTNKVLHEAKTTQNITYGTVINTKDEVIDINGYGYDSADKDSLSIEVSGNIINIYYTKVIGLSYTVNYLEKDTDEVIHPAKTTGEQVFETEITSADEVIDIDGYNYDSVDKDKLIIGTGENVINIYYTKRNDLSYTVNYLEKDTNEVLHVQKNQTGMTFKAEVKSADEKIDIDGYNYDSVDKDSLTITTGENVINIYYTKRTDLSYKVNYLEKTTNKVLHEQKVQENMTFESVVTSTNEVINIDGYNYDSVDKATLKITTGENVINIYYIKRNDLSYTVNYLEKDTNKVLHEQKIQDGMTFESVVTSSNEVIDIDGYKYDSVDKDTLTIGTGENVINIYYTKRDDLSYKVNYLEKGTNKVLHDQKTVENKTFGETIISTDEKIVIDGYNYDSVDKDSLTITTGENVINIYYTKKTDLSYTVNYLEKDTNEVLHNQKIQGGMTFETEVKSADEVININGYKYDSADKESIKITTRENVINIYYTKIDGLSYTVNYLEKDTNEVINPAKTKDGMTFEDVVNSSNEVIDIDGYNYYSVDKDSLTIGTGENVINIYYTKRNDLNYKVNYLEKTTNKVLHNQKIQDGMTFESVITSANEVIEIDGYNYDSVDKATLTITTGENIINIYYTKRNDLNYKVNYLEKTTNKVLHEQKVQDGMTFESVVTSANEVIEIDGYNYDSVDKVTLKITTGENVINIYYTKRDDLSYKVNYLEKTTNKVLHEQKVQDGMTFESVVTSANEVIDIDGYNYDSADKETLTITTGENIINIYYTKRNDLSYTVNYLEKDTNIVLHAPKVTENMTFETTIESSKEIIDIDGYNYDSVDKDKLTITTSENIINIYYKKRNDLSYTVNYLEKDTNKVLNAPKVTDNMIFGTEITSKDEVIKINGYKYDSVDKDSLKITTGANIINVYYTKVTGLSYTVNYLEKDTDEVIHPAKITGEQVFETEITSANEVIDIDGYNYDSVDKEKLIIGTGENVINIYYTKRNDLSYTVNYLEKDTNKVLHAQKNQTEMTFKAEVKSADEKIDIDGYNYDSVDKDSLTITTGENVINIYYTKRNDLSYKVNYLEKDTNKVLHDPKIKDGMTFENVVNSSNEVIDIDGYNYDSVDKATLKITTGENVINIYYIKRNDLSYTVNYLEKTTNKVLHNQKVQEGMTFGDTIKSSDEKISIDGYNYDSVDKDSLTIGTGENVINIYYTKRNDLSYKVNYLEKGTNKVLHDQKIQDKMTFESIVTSANEVIEIDGYNYDSVDKATLKITTGENIINIYYTKRNDLSYTVNYLERDTNKVLHKQKIQDGMTFETEVKSADEVININGYKYDSADKESIKLTTGENVINIYYTKVDGLSYTVNYLEKDTNEVINPAKTKDGMTFEDVVNSSNEVIDIDGYNYDSVDKENLTIGTGENVINIYYTKRNDLKYKVNYLEKGTNKVLHDQKVQEDMTYESVVTSANEVIEIDGYNYDSVDKETLTITTEENVINIYYKKRTDLSYTVNYLEKDTNNVLHEQKVQDGMTFESVVNSSDEVIDIYGYNYDSVDKDTITITTGKNVINIYYTKRNDLSYKVNYLEKSTNKVLHEQKVQDGITFESVVTSANEIIDIDGYNYNSVDKDALTIQAGENVINIYYTKRTDLSYTVNYLEKDTNKVLHEQKVQGNMTFEDAVTSTNEMIDIDGYNYDSVDKDRLVIGTGENVINIYYTKRNDLSYTVNYLEKDTNKVLHEVKTQDGMTFEDLVNSKNYVIAIDGYNYDSVNKDTIIIGTGENVINIYYTKRTDLSYTVNYLEKNTNKVLHEPKVQEIMTFESNIISSDEVIDIYGYSYDSVDKETLTITTSENIINIYYTKKDTKVTVHYYEEGTTNKVSEDIEILGKVFDDYTTISADNIPSKYELVAEPENKNGIMKEEAISVIYYYRKKVTKVVVHYYEENTTKKLTEDVIINGRIDDKYTTRSATNISSKYELVAIPSNAKGSMTEETIEVVYYYRVKEAVVNIRYLEKGTNKVLANPDRLVGKDDDDYQTKAKEIEGYKLVEHTGNENGKFGVEPITITYYYLYKAKATVQYIDKITGKILEESTTDGLEGDDFVTESKDFEKYILVEEPPEKTVKMTKKEQVVKYYYTHVSDGVIEKHIDIISGQVIANDVHNGNEGDTYDIPARTFDGYDLVKDKLPANSKGTMKVEPVEVIYYYIYRTKVTAEYIDKNTGNKLAEEKVQNGYEGDTYTTDRKTFDDYKLVEVPSNADGSMTKENIRVTYYYVHTSGDVIVNHIDIKTGKKLLEETKEKGYEGDPYETHEENISGYDLVKEKYPGNATGKMTRGQIRVTYYYIKKTEVNVKYVDKETGEEIDEPTNIPGHEGDDYTTAPKDIPGYDLVEKTENKDGTMTVDPTEVIYYYKRPAKVIVNYYDIDTKEKITDEIEITGHQNDDYTTEQKDIKYYEISKVPENKEGKMIVTVTKNENGKEFVENTIYVIYYYRKLIFNLKVDQTITSVIVNGQETIINGTLGKVEVHRKNISTADIKVIYKIKVTNDSELTGKANVVENIPSGMIMIADDNPEWTINGTTASLETDEIKPGESREYQVVLRWQNGESNIGTKGNLVSIITENEAGFEEKDKTDNESKADLIVAAETGEVTYVAIAGSILLIMISITAGIYVIMKKRQ